MSDEMKLLEALCEALGFEIKITVDYDERVESPASAEQYFGLRLNLDRCLASERGEYVIDEDGNYISRFVSPIVSYKLIPKTEK